MGEIVDYAFAKRADELLAEDVALVAKAAGNVKCEEERKIIEQMDTALEAYIASWDVVQAIYADEAKIHAERLDKPGAEIAGLLTAIRNGGLAAGEVAAATAVVAVFPPAHLKAFAIRMTAPAPPLRLGRTGCGQAVSGVPNIEVGVKVNVVGGVRR